MEFNAVFTVKKEIEKDSFLRELLVELGKHEETPVDVVSAKIGEVHESIKEVLVCSAFVSGVCTASVGYNRQEPYTDYETYREKVGDTYVTRQRAVTKYRTVTDWRPFKTDYSGDAIYVVSNTDDEDSYRGNASHALKTADDSSIVAKGEADINRYALSRAIMHCESHVEIYNVKLPGDKQKDKRYQSSSDIESVTCYKLPYYEVTFTYEGKEYSAAAFACGDLSISYDAPKKKTEVVSDPVTEIETEAQKNTAALEKNKKFAWLGFWGTLVVGALACFALKFCWVWPLSVAALVFACITNKKYNAEYKTCTDQLALDYAKKESQAQAIHLKAKMNALNQALTSYGYATLNDAETPVIDGESDAVVEKNIPKIAPPKSFKKKAVFCGILAAALIISSLVVNNKVLHSPKYVQIDVVNKEVEYDPYVSSYINGCYYIYLDLEVEAKKIGVDYVEVKILVSDEDGNELGYINTTLSESTIEAGETKTITITLQENQPEKNEFFDMLYDVDIDDLRFAYEIEGIHFDDGQFYFGED